MVQEKLVSSEKTKKEEGVHQDEPQLRFREFSGPFKEVLLGDISSNGMYGMNCAAKEFDGENKYIRITDIDENSHNFVPNPLSSPDGGLEDKFLLKENDIVFARTGASTGKSYLYDKNDGKLYFAGFLIKLEITNAYAPFVYYNTLRENYNNWVSIMSVRSGQPGINLEEYKKFKINLPPLEEQKKIASFLSAVDKKIELLEKTQEKLEKLNFDLINKIMEQNYKIPNRTYDWRRISLYKIGNSFTGLSGKNKEDFSNGNSNFIPYSSIFNDIILDPSKFEQVDINESENQNLVEKGDIFFTGSSETPDDVGMASVLLDDLKNCYLNSFCFGFRLKSSEEYNPLFLVYYFRSLKFKKELFKLAQGSTRFNISKKELLKKEIEVPSKEDQDYYVNLINNMFAKTKHINTELCYMKNFKKGLLQKMFV